MPNPALNIIDSKELGVFTVRQSQCCLRQAQGCAPLHGVRSLWGHGNMSTWSLTMC